MSIEGKGEEIAHLIRYCKNPQDANLILEAFFKLPFEEQVRCMSWLTGNLSALNQREEMK